MTTRNNRAPEGDRRALNSPTLGRSSRAMALRDAGIVADRARGLTWPAVALKHKLSIRRCQEIHQAWREDGLGEGLIDPVKEIRDLIDLLDQAIVDYAIDEVRSKHEAIRVHARRQKIETAITRLDLMRAIGLLPRNLGTLGAEREMQRMFHEYAEVLRAHVSEEGHAALSAFTEGRLHRPPTELASLVAGEAA